MSDLDLKALSEEIQKNFTELRSDVDTVKNRDVVDEAKFNKMTDAITKSMEEMQQKQAKLEAALKRPDTGTDEARYEAEHKAAFAEYIRSGTAPEGVKVGKEGLEVRAMNTNVQYDGGYLVRPAFAQFVIDRVFETSPVRQVARVETIGAKSMEVLIDDNEAEAYWGNEGMTVTETDTPEIGMKEMVARKLTAKPKLTIEQLEDSYIDVERWLQNHVAERFMRMENTAFVSGVGVDRPRGFLTYSAWASAGVYERDKIEQTVSGGATTVTADGAITLQTALKEEYQAAAVFMMKRVTYGDYLKLKGADNFYFGNTFLRDGQATPALLGKRVIFADDMPALAAASLSVAYGDFGRAYTILDRAGLQVLRDPFTAKGFVKYYTTKRVAGDVTSFDAIKLQRTAAS